MILIVDLGMGNVGSIRNMLAKIGAPSLISSSPADIANASRIILPGVGSFDEGAAQLEAAGWIPVLKDRVESARIPLLGICLGMQLLMERSAEGTRAGLGWIKGEAVRFAPAPEIRIPHMGWNTVSKRHDSFLLKDIPPDARFYFAHSYHCVCRDDAEVLLTAHHGNTFTAAVQKGNIFGAQFHPEKSHRFGMQLLRNFAEAGP